MQSAETKDRKIPSPEEIEAMMIVPKWAVSIGIIVLQIIIYRVPLFIIFQLFTTINSDLLYNLVILTSPLIYAILFPITAGILSLPFQFGMMRGIFPRDSRFPVYAMRKLYGICWTSVYYFKPIYGIILSSQFCKILIFRLFGYRGATSFISYPDTWLRDLPVLDIEEGVYIANRAILGSNMPTIDGNIVVGKIKIRRGALLGAQTILAPGVEIGEKSEIGAGVLVGLKSQIGNSSVISAGCIISHKVKIGNNVHIDRGSFIGNNVVIGDGIIVPARTTILDNSNISTQEELKQILIQENK